MANQTLFDDSSQTNIKRFVDNQNSMTVDAQWGNGKSQTFNVQLANVMLNPAHDQTQLFDAVTSYFNGASRFDLNLLVNNTLRQAVTAYCQKIAERFKINVTTDSNQNNPQDKFAIVLADNPNQTILSTFNLNDIFSQNMHLNGLYSHDLYTFHSQLANPAEKDTTLATQYNPTLANNGFHVNTDIIFSYKGQDVDLGNVILTGQCSKD